MRRCFRDRINRKLSKAEIGSLQRPRVHAISRMSVSLYEVEDRSKAVCAAFEENTLRVIGEKEVLRVASLLFSFHSCLLFPLSSSLFFLYFSSFFSLSISLSLFSLYLSLPVLFTISRRGTLFGGARWGRLPKRTS
jgi:hypothetical protein